MRQALRPARCARVRQPTGAASVQPPGAPWPGDRPRRDLRRAPPRARTAAGADPEPRAPATLLGPRHGAPRVSSYYWPSRGRGRGRDPFPAGGRRARGPAARARRLVNLNSEIWPLADPETRRRSARPAARPGPRRIPGIDPSPAICHPRLAEPALRELRPAAAGSGRVHRRGADGGEGARVWQHVFLLPGNHAGPGAAARGAGAAPASRPGRPCPRARRAGSRRRGALRACAVPRAAREP